MFTLVIAAIMGQAADPVIMQPRQLTRIDVGHFYPREAMAAGIEGLTRLNCRLTVSGLLEACRVAQSSGFPVLDEAAFRVANAQRYVPKTIDGVAQEIAVVLPVRWKIAD